MVRTDIYYRFTDNTFHAMTDRTSWTVKEEEAGGKNTHIDELYRIHLRHIRLK